MAGGMPWRQGAGHTELHPSDNSGSDREEDKKLCVDTENLASPHPPPE